MTQESAKQYVDSVLGSLTIASFRLDAEDPSTFFRSSLLGGAEKGAGQDRSDQRIVQGSYTAKTIPEAKQ